MMTNNGFAKGKNLHRSLVPHVCNCLCPGVKEWEGTELPLTSVKRGQMGAFMCIARNNVPPAVSRRIVLNVHCKLC